MNFQNKNISFLTPFLENSSSLIKLNKKINISNKKTNILPNAGFFVF